jgi:hypothetical protein
VDTGASYSIFPHTSSAAPSGPKLRGAAGQLIPCWGEKTFDLSFQGRRFSWTFLLAAVSFPITLLARILLRVVTVFYLRVLTLCYAKWFAYKNTRERWEKPFCHL